jgi:DNA-binding transcriptional ArsR family regulator
VHDCSMVQVRNRKTRGAPQTSSCCAGLAGLLSPRLFKALSDPKRVSLLVRMAEERGPRTVSHIADGSGVDLSVVSRHLAILREAGIIRCVKQGKEVQCSIEPGAVVRVLRDLADALEACCPDERLPVAAAAPPVEPPAMRRPARRRAS